MSTPKEEIEKAGGRIVNASYWWFKMLTDPTQQAARVAAGYSPGPMSEREAFQVTFETFAAEITTPTQDPKYHIRDSRLVNASTKHPIPRDEPLFILRAKDKHAVTLLDLYSRRCADPGHIVAVKQRARDFLQFSLTYPHRMKEPDTK